MVDSVGWDHSLQSTASHSLTIALRITPYGCRVYVDVGVCVCMYKYNRILVRQNIFTCIINITLLIYKLFLLFLAKWRLPFANSCT